MAAEERAALVIKYSSPQISKLKPFELLLHMQGLLLKIHVITGWRLPETQEVLTVLQDQLNKKLTESYGNCNVDEIEFAFRNYGTQIKDWGKNINLNLIDTVMNSYLAHRRDLSAMEERLSGKVEKFVPTDDQLLSAKRETVEMKYQSFLKGNASFTMQPPDGIATLALDGFCEYDIHEDWIERAFTAQKREMQGQIEHAIMSLKKSVADKIRAEMEMLQATDDKVIILAKKMALVYCFYKFREAGWKFIYKNEG